MGTRSTYDCRLCGTNFTAAFGGSSQAELEHCERCGAERFVPYPFLPASYWGSDPVPDPNERCRCGGRFSVSASGRCPGCGSTAERWDLDPNGPEIIYC